ncbi:MAG: hypothetical protein ABFD54_04595 [Armatimonadota bacterium]|nr:YqiJ family protein [bacterium]
MGIDDLLQWWNLIYAIPLLISLVWIIATVFTGAHADGSQGHGAGHDIGHDIGHGIEHAAHGVEHAVQHVHDALGHVDHQGNGAEHAHDITNGHGAHSHADHAHSHGDADSDSLYLRVLLLLGIGRVPITLVIGIFMLCWGAFGLTTNRILAGIMKFPAIYFWPSIGITFVASSIITRALIGVIGHIMPGTETYAVSRFELIGSLGKTIFRTDENVGTVDISDTYGTVHRVQAKTEAGVEEVPAGTEVIIVDFDQQDKRFVVRISNL